MNSGDSPATPAPDSNSPPLLSGISGHTEAYFQVALASAPIAMVMINDSGTIVLANLEAHRIFDYAIGALVGCKLETLIPDRFQHTHVAQRDSFFSNPESRTMGVGRELYGLRRDGSEFPVEVGLNPVHTDAGLFVISAIADISERLRMHIALEERARELERSNRELQEFAYVASHDLKSPLRAILHLAEWIGEDEENQLSEQSREDLVSLQKRSHGMSRLLDDLLAYSRVGRKAYETVQINLQSLVAEIIDSIDRPADISITIHGAMPTLLAPPVPMRLVLQNLIENAVKHHDLPDGKIQISAEESAQDVLLKIQDNGPGILPENRAKVFEIFVTLDKESGDKSDSSGMGLALVRKTVEVYGGSIAIESPAEGRGTVFCVRWPRQAASPV